VFVGHSLGGLVARLYESQFPDEVAGLVVVGFAMPLSMVTASIPSTPPARTHSTLVDVSTDEDRDPDYVEFQTKLLSLSQNSKEIIAAGSSHCVIIDRPDAVIDATNQVVRSVRTNSKL
jgi:pimeloyl-ACP methyl ester carboxylesterase